MLIRTADGWRHLLGASKAPPAPKVGNRGMSLKFAEEIGELCPGLGKGQAQMFGARLNAHVAGIYAGLR